MTNTLSADDVCVVTCETVGTRVLSTNIDWPGCLNICSIINGEYETEEEVNITLTPGQIVKFLIIY